MTASMRVVSLSLLAFVLVHGTSAQYLSEGWKPGQPETKANTDLSYQPTPTPVTSVSLAPAAQSQSRLSSHLSAHLESLFRWTGVSISEKLDATREQPKLWDERILLITDDSYQDLIVDEKFNTLEEEKDRLWFIVITVSTAQGDGFSRLVDGQFDKAFDMTQQACDLKHVRWGRIDYMNVTAITTKWAVWRAPYLIVLKDRGRTLRFYRPGQIRLQPEMLREFLKYDEWKGTPPWRSAFSPGGSREFIMEFLAIAWTRIYNVIVLVPRWALFLLTGSLASFSVNLLHNSRWFSRKPQSLSTVVNSRKDAVPYLGPPSEQGMSKGDKGRITKKRTLKK